MKKYIPYQSIEFFLGNNLVQVVVTKFPIHNIILDIHRFCLGSFVFKPSVLFKILSLLVSLRNFMTLFDKLQ